MQKISTKKMVQISLLIALEIALTRFCSITTPIVRIGFGFIPVAITGMLYGPIWAGVAAATGDFLGAILFPTGAFFPGFTLTAFLTGVTYGLFLHNEKRSWGRIALAVGIVSLLLNLGLDTLWLYMITGKGYLALLPTRIVKCLIMSPVQIVALHLLSLRVNMFFGVRQAPEKTSIKEEL